MTKCTWVLREGTNDSLFAYTTCKPGFNYLSRSQKKEMVKMMYDGRLCPICYRPIHIKEDEE